MLLPLSERQEETLQVIRTFIREKNYPPTIPEVQECLSISNPGAVHKCFQALEKKGYILRTKGMHRGLDLTQEAKEYLQ
ncbi:LexA family protein [Halobacteriovorax sp. RT-2-6]|uniref:LexA family protein n=1 Tax=unclassified Halobacteriovorax TaxID=2639665 RepID=UPI00399AECD5